MGSPAGAIVSREKIEGRRRFVVPAGRYDGKAIGQRFLNACRYRFYNIRTGSGPANHEGEMDAQDDIAIRPVRLEDLDSLNATVNGVCRERRFLSSMEGFPRDIHRRFLNRVVRYGLPQVVAVCHGDVIGWCDIMPVTRPGAAHVGRLGVGVARPYRRRGTGRRLITRCLEMAREYGMKKVELEVFSDNEVAIGLYRSFGFAEEGLKRNARRFDGHYQHIVVMGRAA